MRPVSKGRHPKDEQGKPKEYSSHKEYRGNLIDRLGEYCSYCEGRIQANLAVEHKIPQIQDPALELAWKNFLLACTNCNSTKGRKVVQLPNFYWPDQDNTSIAFVYKKGGRVKVNPNLTPQQQKIAQDTLELTGLDRIPSPDPKRSDRRWINRKEAWEQAKSFLKEIQQFPEEKQKNSIRKMIVRNALSKGFFSVWMTVFQNDPEMLKLFIKSFLGTSSRCFDEEGNAIPRKSGQI